MKIMPRTLRATKRTEASRTSRELRRHDTHPISGKSLLHLPVVVTAALGRCRAAPPGRPCRKSRGGRHLERHVDTDCVGVGFTIATMAPLPGSVGIPSNILAIASPYP